MTVSKHINKTYTEEFKRDAVRLAGERGNIAAVARDVGIDASNLRKWIRLVKEEGERPFPGRGNPQDPEPAALLKENARLREDNEILKKGSGYLHQAAEVRYHFVNGQKELFPIVGTTPLLRASSQHSRRS